MWIKPKVHLRDRGSNSNLPTQNLYIFYQQHFFFVFISFFSKIEWKDNLREIAFLSQQQQRRQQQQQQQQQQRRRRRFKEILEEFLFQFAEEMSDIYVSFGLF